MPAPLPTLTLPALPAPITRLALGTLPLGPLQRGLNPAEGARVVRAAVEGGITFLDTATGYRTYEHLRRGLDGWTRPLVIATKTPALDPAVVDEHVEKARRELDRDVLDIMLAHCARAKFSDGSWDACWDALQRHKAAGRIRLVGLSTHSALEAKLAAARPDVDVIHPLVNRLGMGILEGGLPAMLEAVADAGRAGKFVYGMKALAGGHLIERRDEALRYVFDLPGISAVAVGMVTADEVEYNLRWARGEAIPARLAEATRPKTTKRLALLTGVCIGCGRCVEHCENEALRLEGGVAAVDHGRCILCGYCAPYCPQFAIRMA